MVANRTVNVEVSDFADVLAVARPLFAEAGADTVDIERADPNGARKGYVVSLWSGQDTGHVPRDDFTPRGGTDVISRIRLRLPVGDPGTALEQCRPFVARARASRIQATSSDGTTEVVLVSAFPTQETGDQALRAVAIRLIADLGLDGSGFEIQSCPDGVAGVLQLEPTRQQPVYVLYVRVGADPGAGNF